MERPQGAARDEPASAAPAGARPALARDPSRGGRSGALDALRGLAVAGMVAFHIAWDLEDWGWTATSPAASPAWMAFGHVVASTFLFLSGYCLVLARGRGPVPALRRIGVLAAAAGLVTAVSAWLFPGEVIVFGILHCIAASNLIGLALLRRPVWVVLLGAGAAAAAPALLTSPGLDGPIGWCLGLSPSVPATLDYRPVLPWASIVLCGVAAGRLRPPAPRPGAVRPPAWAAPLAWAGRHSLAVYLVHQPVLFGLLTLAATLQPRPALDEAVAFGRQCRTQCEAAGAGREGCAAACACVARRLRSPAVADPKAPLDLRTASQACLGTFAPAP